MTVSELKQTLNDYTEAGKVKDDFNILVDTRFASINEIFPEYTFHIDEEKKELIIVLI